MLSQLLKQNSIGSYTIKELLINRTARMKADFINASAISVYYKRVTNMYRIIANTAFALFDVF